MKGKVCLVTGASSGVGFETAKALAAQGATVAMVGRDPKRSQAGLERIRKATKNPDVRLYLVDLSSLDEVRGLAKQVRADYRRLDVLVNNAAVWLAKRTVTKDGYEAAFATNHLAHFLLTLELLPLMKATASARTIHVNSGLHERARLDFDDLQSEKKYTGMDAYAKSKVASMLFTYELARRLKGTKVTSNAVFPGMVRTRWYRDAGFSGRLIYAMMYPMAKTPAGGADTVVWASTAPELEGVTGKYFADRKETQSSTDSHDEALAKRVWAVSERLTGASMR